MILRNGNEAFFCFLAYKLFYHVKDKKRSAFYNVSMSKNKQISDRQIKIILDLLAESLELDGDVVEFGCYEGDTSVKMGKLIRNKKLWLYDSFEGLPEKSDADFSSIGEAFKAGELKASKNVLMKRFLHANLPIKRSKSTFSAPPTFVSQSHRRATFILLHPFLVLS